MFPVFEERENIADNEKGDQKLPNAKIIRLNSAN